MQQLFPWGSLPARSARTWRSLEVHPGIQRPVYLPRGLLVQHPGFARCSSGLCFASSSNNASDNSRSGGSSGGEEPTAGGARQSPLSYTQPANAQQHLRQQLGTGLRVLALVGTAAAALLVAQLRPAREVPPAYLQPLPPCEIGACAGGSSSATTVAWPGGRVSQAAAARPAFASATVSKSVGPALVPSMQRQGPSRVIALKLTHAVQQVLAANLVIKILAVFATTAPIVWTGGFLYSLITGSPITLGLFKIWSVITRVPGAKVTEETSIAAAVLMNAFFLVGVFSFAVLIGIISEEIKTQLREVRTGNYPVVTADHTLLLNWNRHSTSLLRKMAQNSHGRGEALGRELVILSEQPKDAMDAAVQQLQQLPGGGGMRVVTRHGAPHSVRDLEAVSAARAKTVILLHPDKCEDADANKAATILSLEAARSHPSISIGPQKIILQNPDFPAEISQHSDEAARSKGLMSLIHKSVVGQEMKVVEVNGNRNIARLLAQSAVQPGVSSVYSSIAQQAPGAPDFYLKSCGEELHGKTYQEARRSYTDAVVCGYVSHGNTHLNPSDAIVLEQTDRLIVLAHSGDVRPKPGGLLPAGAASPSLEELVERLKAAVLPPRTPKSVVVLGWRGEVADLASAIEEFAAPGSEVIFVGNQRPEDIPESTPKCSFHYLEGSPYDYETCRRAGVASAHAIILGSLDCDNSRAQDARMLASLLVVQDLVTDASQRSARMGSPHVVATIHRHETVHTARHILKELGRDRLSAELLQPGELVSGMLLQVANEPGLAPALSELIDNSQGQEIYLRRPQLLGLDPERAAPFAEVEELARLRGETALGYVAGDGSLVLAPEAGSTHVYSKATRVVVMAEN